MKWSLDFGLWAFGLYTINSTREERDKDLSPKAKDQIDNRHSAIGRACKEETTCWELSDKI